MTIIMMTKPPPWKTSPRITMSSLPSSTSTTVQTRTTQDTADYTASSVSLHFATIEAALARCGWQSGTNCWHTWASALTSMLGHLECNLPPKFKKSLLRMHVIHRLNGKSQNSSIHALVAPTCTKHEPNSLNQKAKKERNLLFIIKTQ